jgi:ribosomal subunit interface protein|tara:strand:- start:619 stop:1011 length:393 start_codon:yes stop_codon:yes gene_type:complete
VNLHFLELYISVLPLNVVLSFTALFLTNLLQSGVIMSIHLTFNNIRNSKAVSEHVHHVFEELIKITDDKYPFHVNLNKVREESYRVGINCLYKNKSLSSKADHQNLYKALAKGIDSMKIQVIRKAEKVRS